MPLLNVVYEEEDLTMYLVNISGVLTLHNDIRGEISISRLKHLRELYDTLCVLLIERGLDHLDTWVYPDDERGLRFAEHFGFVPTGQDVIVQMGGFEHQMEELRCEFPALEEIS